MTTNRRAGLALIAGAVAILGVMIWHPTGREAAGAGYGISTIVHAVAILAELTVLLGALGLSVHLRGARDTALAAFVTYAAATMSLIIAAVAAGWIDPPAAGTLNASFATVGFGLAAVAMVLWSVAMWRTRFSRTLAIFGAAVGVFTLTGLVHGAGLTLHGFGGLVMLAFTVWVAWTGMVLKGQAA
ncbi:MAG TPA: hypothetical protein VMT87_12270 [Vicinamibacteria bacterium]|nr:hypothetical protein [Vicinamibacteria bacterium]